MSTSRPSDMAANRRSRWSAIVIRRRELGIHRLCAIWYSQIPYDSWADACMRRRVRFTQHVVVTRQILASECDLVDSLIFSTGASLVVKSATDFA